MFVIFGKFNPALTATWRLCPVCLGSAGFILLAFLFTHDLGLNVKGIRVKTILLVAKKWSLKVSIEMLNVNRT